jgi:hypothetical protein
MSKYIHAEEFSIDKEFLVGQIVYYIEAEIEVGYDKEGDMIENSLDVQQLSLWNQTDESELIWVSFSGDTVSVADNQAVADAVNSLLWQEAMAFTENNWETIKENIDNDIADGGDL